MKEIKDKYFFTVAACLLIVSCSNYKRIRTDYAHVKVRKDDLAEVKHFLSYDFNKYKGKTVGELFKGIDRQSIGQGFNQEPLFVAYGFSTDYPNNICIQVYINSHFTLHIPNFTDTDVDSIKSEKLKGIKLFYKNKCIKWLEDY